MGENIHHGARTTLAIRKEIQKSTKTTYALAKEYNVSRATIKKWRNRDSIYNQKPGPSPKSKHITEVEESAIVAFRVKTRLGLDDCLQAFKKQIPKLSRSALHRLFKRHRINKLPDLEPQKKEKKKFKEYAPGYVHVDITQVHTCICSIALAG